MAGITRTTMKLVATAAVLASLTLGAPAGDARLTRADRIRLRLGARVGSG